VGPTSYSPAGPSASAKVHSRSLLQNGTSAALRDCQ
jgi:hypothetical protein